MGRAETSPPPREQLHIQSTGTNSKPVRFDRGPKYHNLDPVVSLIGPPNEAWVEVKSVATYAPIDTGVQITTIAHSFIRQLQLEVHDLNEVIQVEGAEAFMVPYSGYIEVNLWILQFPSI